MRTKLVRFACSMIVGSLLSAAPIAAHALPVKTALSGDQQAVVHPEGSSVQSLGKWTLVTNAHLTGTFAFSGGNDASLAGTFTRVVNVKIDAAKNGILWGAVSYVDKNTGVTCTGFNHGTLSNDFFTGKVVASCSNGSLLRGTLQDTKLTYNTLGNLIAVKTHFTGTLLNPGG